MARGDETAGDPGPQPKGANIRELKWNDELADVAQVNHFIFYMEFVSRKTVKVTENREK